MNDTMSLSNREWIECKLGELVKMNKNSISSNYTFNEIQYLDTGSITEGKIESFQNFKLLEAPSRAKRLVEDNDIIYSTVRPIQRHYGFITNPQENLVVSTGFVTITTIKEKLNPKFLYYFLISNETVEYLDLIAEASTSAYPSLKPSDIGDIDILLPPLSEQKAIAGVLSSLDDKIDLLHRQNKTLEAMAETLFRQWFVEEADESWEIGKLRNVISLFDSKRIPLSSLERDKMKLGQLYPYYGAATIMDYINDYIFDGEYILIAEDGSVETDDGYPILQLPVGKFWVNNHTHILQAKQPYSNFFIYIFLKQTNIASIVTGAVQPKINQNALNNIEFIIPPEDKVQKFIELTNYFWDKIKSNNNQIRTLIQLRDTLLPKLMSGEVKVRY